MNRIKFNVGDKIVTVINGELCNGVIKELYPINPPVVVVRLEDGSLAKMSCNDIAPEPVTETQETDEPIEKSEITITPEKFRDIVARVIAEETKEHPLVALAFASIMGNIHRALFMDEWKNE